MFKKIDEQKPIKVIIKIRDHHRTERDVLGEVETFEEAFDIM